MPYCTKTIKGGEVMNRNEYKYLADNNNSELDIISQTQRENKELKTRAEKAESELQAIRDRIEAVNIDDICEITHHLIEILDTAQSITLYEKILNFIKQIGGVK